MHWDVTCLYDPGWSPGLLIGNEILPPNGAFWVHRIGPAHPFSPSPKRPGVVFGLERLRSDYCGV